MQLKPGEFCATLTVVGDIEAVLLRAKHEFIPGVLSDDEMIASHLRTTFINMGILDEDLTDIKVIINAELPHGADERR